MGDGWYSTRYRQIVCPCCGHEHNWPLPVKDDHTPFTFKCESCGEEFEAVCYVQYKARTFLKED